MEEWKTYKLGDLCNIHRGASPRPIQKFLSDKGQPWVKISDATSDSSRFISTTKEFIIEDGIKHSVIVTPGTLIVSNSATPGLPKIMKIEACVHDGWLIIDQIRDCVLKEYLYYSFINIRRNLSNQANGSVFQNLKTEIVKNFEIKIPSLSKQRLIVDVLSSIEDKIDLNNRINHNLEEQADGIVSSLLNVGTTVLRLSDICKYVSQKIDCQSLTLDNYISTENMVPSRGGVTKSSNVPTGTAIEYSSGDILVSNIRPYFQKIWKATYSGGCSNDVLCFRSSTNSPSFLYHLLRQNSFFDHVMAGAKGSKMPRGDKAQIMNWTFVLSEDWEAMESKLSIIDKKVALLRVQNLMLIELRDSVLPRLMSGELKINDLTC